MSAPESAEIGATRYDVTIVYPFNETVEVGGEEAKTLEEATELAVGRGGVSLCHQCSKQGSLGDPLGEVVEVFHQDGTRTVHDSMDDERDEDAARHQYIGRAQAFKDVLALIEASDDYDRTGIVALIINQQQLDEAAENRRTGR